MPFLERFVLLLVALLYFAGPLSALDGWNNVDAEQLMKWLKQIQPPLLLDIRGSQTYREGSIPEALNTGMDPAGFLPDGRGGPVVLIPPQPIDRQYLAAWIERLTDHRHVVYVLVRGLSAWRNAGGEVVNPEEIYVKPGTVPFVIPKGLCEGNDPAQEYF